MPPRWTAWMLAGLLALGVAACGSSGEEPARPAADRSPEATATASPEVAEAPDFRRVPGVTTVSESDLGGDRLAPWRQAVPEIADVSITSSQDGERQPALWLAPEGDEARPLLLVLHSWSTGYRQNLGIPFARWAERENWGFIHPDFRGVNDDPEATGSDLAVSDTLDAIDYAVERGEVDPDQVYVVGFSGGGMSSLLMAGRHPERFAGVVAWVPIHDLNRWYAHNADNQPEQAYDEQIQASCGGDPRADDEARESCAQRSPAPYLARAGEADLPIYIGHGLEDSNVPVTHSVRAFNQLAAADDRLPPAFVRAVADQRLPDAARGSIETPTFFGDRDPEVLFARRSGDIKLVIFEGGHDMVYNPGLEWMQRLAAGAPVDTSE